MECNTVLSVKKLVLLFSKYLKSFQIIHFLQKTQVEDQEREVARLVRLLEGERREKEEEAKVFHKKVNIAWLLYFDLPNEAIIDGG